jgi:GDP-fucose transporter C1
MASACVALNAIYIKKVMPAVDDDMWRLTAYNNVNALFLFLPVMVVMGEIPVVINASEIYNATYWIMMTIAGLFGRRTMEMGEGCWRYFGGLLTSRLNPFPGIAIGLVTMLQINVTSPLTHNISGTAKVGLVASSTLHPRIRSLSPRPNPSLPPHLALFQACAQTILALQIDNESRTATWWLGNLFVLGGSLGYAVVKRSEMKATMDKLPVSSSGGGASSSAK